MEHTYTVALAGNPNVGKSTVFNRLTGLRQHTGNWPGKTVERAEGYFSQAGQRFRLVDLPGTYSLAADSPEEEVAGAFLQSGQADAVIVVVDASCLRRGLILALQLRQQTQRLVLCVNLMDEAARRGVTPQTERLGQLLDVPVVATAARSGKGLAELRHQAAEVCRREPWEDGWKLTYVPPVEAALGLLETGMSRRRAVALLWGSPPTEGEQSLWQRAQQRLGALSGQALRDSLTASVVALAEEIGRQCVRCAGPDPHAPDRRLDRLLTSRLTGFPVMLFAAGAGVLPDHTGGQCPLPAAEPVADGAGGTTAGSAGRSAVVGAGGCGGRHLPDGGVGGGGDAAPPWLSSFPCSRCWRTPGICPEWPSAWIGASGRRAPAGGRASPWPWASAATPAASPAAASSPVPESGWWPSSPTASVPCNGRFPYPYSPD